MNERDDMHNRHGDFALDEPLPLGAAEPVDVVQVRADDALIAAISAAEHVQVDDPIDERLAGLLRSWRDDVHAEPMHADSQRRPIDIGAAAAALTAAPRTPRPSRSTGPFGPLATAAAVLVIAFIGLGLAAKGAEPGDPLWNVTKVIYSDKAKSVEAAATVEAKLDQASKALQDRNIDAARVALAEAKQKLPVVAPEHGKDQLTSKTEQLMAKVDGPPPPSAPESSAATVSATTTAVSTTVPPPPAVTTSDSPAATTTDQTSPTPNVPSSEPTSGVSPSGVPGETPPERGPAGEPVPESAPRSDSNPSPADPTSSGA